MSIPSDRLVFCFGLGALLLATSCSSSSDPAPPAQSNISETLEPQGLITLLSAVTEAGLLEALGTGELTLFAPTNEAFDELPAGYLASLTDQELSDLVLYHVVNTGALPSQTLLTLAEATMANQDQTLIDVVDGELYINEARVGQTDIQASNGVIHIIDRVLLPPRTIAQTLALRGDFETLLGLLPGLDGLDEDTALAPTDAAFGLLPPDFLANLSPAEVIELISYHIIEGRVAASSAILQELVETTIGEDVIFGLDESGLKVNGATISLFNIKATDGVIHVLDAVLIPPTSILATVTALEGFETFVGALEAAGMDTLLGDSTSGPFTSFAPTNEAFDAMPAGLLDSLLEPQNQDLLIQVLEYHLSLSVLTAKGVLAAAGTGIETVQGSTLAVTSANGNVMVDGAALVTPNLLATNGIIHAIDAVLIPPGVIISLK